MPDQLCTHESIAGRAYNLADMCHSRLLGPREGGLEQGMMSSPFVKLVFGAVISRSSSKVRYRACKPLCDRQQVYSRSASKIRSKHASLQAIVQ